jgi:hypothetical protein
MNLGKIALCTEYLIINTYNEGMERRKFIKKGALGSLMLGGVFPSDIGKKKSEENQDFIEEETRKLKIKGFYDVIVCGGGPAGIAAAISAARNGAKTLLLELNGCLGGIWTSGLLSWIMDHSNKKGIIREIEECLRKTGAISPVDTGKNMAFDVEKMKLILETMCLESEVDVMLHTRVTGTKKNEDNRLTHVITESKSFREAWSGKIFIDATGDGDIAALCGCGYDFGSEGDMNFQPMSLLMLVSGIKFKEIEKYVRWAEDKESSSKKRLLQEMARAGISPSYINPSIFPVCDDLFMIMTNHEYGLSGLNARDVTKATLRARKELHAIVDGLKSLGHPWTNLRIVATAGQIGIREGRRIHGLYKVTKDDLINGIRHPDAVCRVTFGVDVHSVKKENETRGKYNQGIKSKPYDIPVRALIAKDIKGLMMAGRCVSGDFIAHSSYRVTGNAVPMGEACGKVSALAAGSGRLPQDISWKETGIETN